MAQAYIDIFCYFTLLPPAFTVLARGAKSYITDPDVAYALDWAAERGLETSVALALLWTVGSLIWLIRATFTGLTSSRTSASSPNKPKKSKKEGGKAATPSTASDSSSSTLLAFLTLTSTPIVTAALLLSRGGIDDDSSMIDLTLLPTTNELIRLLLGGLQILFVLASFVFTLITFGTAASTMAGSLGPSTDPSDGPLATEEEWMEWGEGAAGDY
ncbi:hypothetical protein FB45DRAFT_941275 [Roridomyces roridus]|uniref:Uncharacterized protein n=1 Tax=Roridomyces roridus TaxID=1738132 RepID=A0AAD7FCR2_9AGAR|nr:hypothetical protein FB45DRAFT_941275 [Roridomyces roridus]